MTWVKGLSMVFDLFPRPTGRDQYTLPLLDNSQIESGLSRDRWPRHRSQITAGPVLRPFS
jgi:hypothetical protein